jgi:hypothetical protein
MRSKTAHKQHVYNMRGCSSLSSSCSKKNKKNKKNKKSQKKMSWKGGCGDGTCPMTNHSMIGGYLRGDRASSKRRRSSKRRSSKRSSDHSSHASHDDSDVSEMRGGNIFSDVIRGVAYNGGVINNALKGYPPPVSPAPYANQFRSTFSKM